MSMHAEDSAYALLIDGTTIEIRAAPPGDFHAVRDMHAKMSPDNLYLRFFSMSPQVAEQEARRICREPGPDHAALRVPGMRCRRCVRIVTARLRDLPGSSWWRRMLPPQR
jgi:hypothetical protein